MENKSHIVTISSFDHLNVIHARCPICFDAFFAVAVQQRPKLAGDITVRKNTVSCNVTQGM